MKLWAQVVEDARRRGLVRTALENRSSNDDGDVKEGTERGNAENDRCNGDARIPKVAGERAAEK